ncbi:MAG: GtrA family protein [Mediterranea sp.]|jgi:putative flippase GtrA|nr:GtrA family protein [Mediterranea sp.]
MIWRQIKCFTKAQFSAGIGYVCDYSFMLLLKEGLGVNYLVAIAAGGLLGAVVNFTINHFWAFHVKDGHYALGVKGQLWRFACVLVGGLTLKIMGTDLLTSWTGIDYKLTRLVMDALVAVFFNYLLMRLYVFNSQRTELLKNIPNDNNIHSKETE